MSRDASDTDSPSLRDADVVLESVRTQPMRLFLPGEDYLCII